MTACRPSHVPLLSTCVVAALLASWHTGAASAESEGFFRNRQINLVVGFNPGGTYDLYSRLLAVWLPRYIAGHPTIVVRNMPGAGGAKAGAYLYSQAPRDGLTIGMLSQSAALAQVLKDPTVAYDVAKMGWLGRVTPVVEATVVWHSSPVKSIADTMTRETVLASTSVGSTPDLMPLVMNRIVGTRFKLVRGYAGTTGGQLAMENGEVEGAHATIENLLVERPDWLRDKRVTPLVVYAQVRHRALPETPTMVELGKTPEDRQVLALFGGTAEIGRSLVAPPDVPAGQFRELREAFAAMNADPAFAAELAGKHMEFGPLDGAALQKLIGDTIDVTPGVIARAIAAQAPD